MWFFVFNLQEPYCIPPVPQAKKEKLDISLTKNEQISLLQNFRYTANEGTSNNDEDTETEGETIEDSAEDSN